MPVLPAQLCRSSTCTSRAVNGSPYCDVHQNAKSDYKRLYDRYRQDDPIRKMYRTARWKATRQAVIKRDILCKICGHKAATVVDHIEPARIIVSTLGVDAFFEIDRLQALCSECHNVKTIGESHWAGSHK